MKVLILGSNGNLGTQLVKIFKIDDDVIGWDRNDIDIISKEEAKKKIKNLQPDIIVNAIAYNAVDKCEEGEDEFGLAKKINGEAVGILADVALEINALLVHYSTDYVFNGNKKGGYQENDIPKPINKYGETKLIGEKEILMRCGQGLKFYIIRTSKLFGPRGKSEFSKPSFFDIMLGLSAEKNKIEVVDNEMSCFTYTPDLANATKELIVKKKSYGIYHIVNSGPCTWYGAALEFFKIIGKNICVDPISSDKLERAAKRPNHSVLVNTKFTLLRDYKEALKEYFKK